MEKKYTHNKEFEEMLLADRHLFEDDDSFKVEVPNPRTLEQMIALQQKEDSVLNILIKRVEDMKTADKTGMSLIDSLRPYSGLYNYVMMEIGNLCERDREKAENFLYGK